MIQNVTKISKKTLQMPHTRYKYNKQEKYEQCKLYLLSLKYKKALVKYEGYSLGYLDSNQEWMNQNHLCCQLHHTPIGRLRGSWDRSVFVPPTGFEPVLAP